MSSYTLVEDMFALAVFFGLAGNGQDGAAVLATTDGVGKGDVNQKHGRAKCTLPSRNILEYGPRLGLASHTANRTDGANPVGKLGRHRAVGI